MIDRDSLRELIRIVIDTELSEMQNKNASTAKIEKIHKVEITQDEDLRSFARMILRLAEDKEARALIEAGKYPFSLVGRSEKSTSLNHKTAERVDCGILTESALAKLPKGLRRLEIGPEVVITPLARERARTLGIHIERRRT